MIFNAAGRSSTVQVSHRAVAGGGQFDRVEPLDGPERHIYRHNDEVRVYWPQARTALVQQREPALAFPRQWAQADERILDFYDVDLLGQQRWAGHLAAVLLFKPRDQFRYGQRVWTEPRSGLVLRSEMIAPQGQVIEWSAFTQLVLLPVDSKPLPEPDSKALEGWRWLRSELQTTTLTKEGWQVGDLPPGFRLLTCVKRALPAKAASMRASAAEGAHVSHVIQAIFGDGITHVSVFIEPFDPARHARELLLVQGATQTLKRRAGAWWLTVVGDVPATTVQRFGQAFERL